MRAPTKDFPKAALCSHVLVLCAYLALCLMAFLAYGQELRAADIVTDVMRLKWAVWMVPILFTLSLCTALPLFLCPIGESIQNYTLKDNPNKHDVSVEKNARMKIRCSLLISCALVASIGDEVAVFQAFCGAVTTTLTCYTFPVILPAFLKLKRKGQTAKFWDAFSGKVVHLVGTASIIAAGCLGFFSGMWFDGTILVENAMGML